MAYELLKREDPYHPTGLVLNCYNYYFDEYTSGADYVMEDAYPVGINATWSYNWNTACNLTYGDCGCDDCLGELQDVSIRLDAYYEYQEWLGGLEKPVWSVLQAFSDDGYWKRDPTTKETWAMMVLSFNHGAKAIMSWDFPTGVDLARAHGEMARAATASPVKDFLVGTRPMRVAVDGHSSLDVAYWVLDNRVMVGVANTGYADINESVSIELPVKASNVSLQPWGSAGWSVVDGKLTSEAFDGLETSFVILDL